MDFPLFEVTSEQYRDGRLNYSIEDYVKQSKEVGNKDFYYVMGEETPTKFLYDVTDRYLVGDLDIKVIRLVYDDPLPVPLSLPLSSSGIQKGDRYEIKAKNPRNAKEFVLVFGDQSLEIPLNVEQEEVVLEVTGVEDGRCTARLNGVEMAGVISQGPFLTDRMVLEGDLDFHWVAIVKPGGNEGAAEGIKEPEEKLDVGEKSTTDKA
ncbi:hypothetical protein V5799_019054 [Amblyomma americanum]|uniref:Uncharacterized protein n=1 Tax=Amblyomma americanum TaxID=6943 RepID=A0AAQ4EXL9_AMBAM